MADGEQNTPGPTAAERIRVVDLTTGMAGALAVRILRDTGATVHRVAPPGDAAMRAVHPAYEAWHARSLDASTDDLEDLLGAADVAIVGGEDHTEVRTRRDAADISARHPDLVVVDLAGYSSAEHRGAAAVDSLVQARTGMGSEHFSDRPFRFAVPLPSTGQALLAVVGVWAGLLERLDSGFGQVVRASLQRGAELFMMPFWMSAERPDAEFGKVTPKDVEHLIFRCADDTYVQFVMGVPSAVAKLYGVLGIDEPVDPADRGFPKVGAPPERFFGNRPLIGEHAAKMNRADILARAAEVGLPAAPVREPGEMWSDGQVIANGILVESAAGTTVGNLINRLTRRSAGGHRWVRTGSGAPLDGIRVLDLGAFVAGPFVSRILGDLGAEVIKVDPLHGDPGRGTMRHYLACQVGKRDIAVDLKAAEGAAVLADLIRRSDVLVHNFRVGVDERLGVGPAQLAALRPALVSLQSNAFGPVGPRAADPGFDMVVQALVGMERRAGGPDRPPVWYRTPTLDYATGTLGAAAVLLALYEREVDGTAGDLWVSLLNSGMLAMSDMVRYADGSFGMPQALHGDGLGTHVTERYYRTADGWIAVAARGPVAAGALWRTLVGTEPDGDATEWGESQRTRLDAAFAQLSTDEAGARLRAARVPAEPFRQPTMPDSSRDDDHYGRVRGHLGPMVDFSRTRLPQHGRPGVPALGEHTVEILGELGYPADRIEALVAGRVVGTGRSGSQSDR